MERTKNSMAVTTNQPSPRPDRSNAWLSSSLAPPEQRPPVERPAPLGRRQSSSQSGRSRSNGGKALYGMLRKTKRRALSGRGRTKARGRDLRDGGNGDDVQDSSSSTSSPEGVAQAMNFSRGVQAAGSGCSPFGPSRLLQPSGTFYYSPQNSWQVENRGAGFGDAALQLPHRQSAGKDMEHAVLGVERALRQLALCCAAFVAGTAMSDRASVGWHALELSLVAWGTCMAIVVLDRFQGWQKSADGGQNMPLSPSAITVPTSTTSLSVTTPMTSNAMTGTASMEPPSFEGFGRGPSGKAPREQEMLKALSTDKATPSSAQMELRRKRSLEDLVGPGDDSGPPSPKAMRGTGRPVPVPAERPLQHPQLENLYVMWGDAGDRVYPNGAPSDIDNDLLSGRMLLMFRTSDVDEPGTSTSDPYAPYFRGKQRRFEFQWQFRLKRPPSGNVFMGVEVAEPIQMGMIQRVVSGAALKFVKKMNQGFSYHFSDSPESGPSYLSFPVETSMDRFACADVGETPPELGEEVVEDAELMRQRKRGAKIEWSTGKVYTMAIWSAYFDWIDWQFLNFPGIRPFSATSVVGVQPIKMTLYTTPFDSTEKSHERNTIFSIEVSNVLKSSMGCEARKFVAEEESALRFEMGVDAGACEMADEVIDTAVESSEIDSMKETETFDENEDLDGELDDQSENMYDDTRDIEDLEEDDEGEVEETPDNIDTGCYLLSGVSISLREGKDNYVASGGGYAVLQSSPTLAIVLEKFQSKKKKKKGTAPASGIIRNGDVVRVKLMDITSKSVKHLSLHRGWWLRWVSARPGRNGLFYVHTADQAGSLVVLGCPFSLVSRRWSHYPIGACAESSAKYGGRMLGIYKKTSSAGEAGDEEADGPGQEEGPEDKDFPAGKMRDKRIVPLVLYAEAYCATDCDLPSLVKTPSRMLKTVRQISLEDTALGIPELDGAVSQLSQKRYQIDVPVWLEVMNRTKRTIQLVYAVRVHETFLVQSSQRSLLADSEDAGGEKNKGGVWTSHRFVTLQTGRGITPLLVRLGVERGPELSPPSDQWQQRFDLSNQDDLDDGDSVDSFTSSSDDSNSEEEIYDEQPQFLIAGPNHSGVEETFMTDQGNDCTSRVLPEGLIQQQDTSPRASSATQSNSTFDDSNKAGCKGKDGNGIKRPPKTKRDQPIASIDSENPDDSLHRENSLSNSSRRKNTVRAHPHFGYASLPDAYLATSLPDGEDYLPVAGDTKKRNIAKAKSTAVIGRVAKTVRSSTVITGKHVIKHSKNIGKGTVSAGRAAGRVIPVPPAVYSIKQPKSHEPGGRVNRKNSNKGQMKMVGRAIKNIEGQGYLSTCLLSGQLLAPDQSCRKVSQILSDISNTPNNSDAVLDAIAALATPNAGQDLYFLRGSSAELGVKPLKPVDSKEDFDCVVARCIYEGRWREELCILYSKENHIAFYAPLAKEPTVVVSFDEIMCTRKCEEDELSPLPGFPILAAETALKCHYLAFLNGKARESFLKRLNDALFYTSNQGRMHEPRKVAPAYESYRMSLEASLTGMAGKWHGVSINKKSKHKKQRRILNGRRMSFDLVPITNWEMAQKHDSQEKVATYVENLLRMALSFSPNALDPTDPRFIEFLDETSRLRTLPLHDIDFLSKGAFCIFVNLYHTLLQHSLLLAVDGLPSKKSVTRFKRCSCYEVGGDVFSLAELECCVIRGRTGRPSYIKPPFVDVAKASRPYREMYALGATDHRINFVLNNGDVTYPALVPVLQSQTLEDQIYAAACVFLKDQVKIDKRKRAVFLPKVCDVYRNDFGMGDVKVCLSACLIYLEESSQLAIAGLLEGDGVVAVKFRRNCEDFHPNLTELGMACRSK